MVFSWIQEQPTPPQTKNKKEYNNTETNGYLSLNKMKKNWGIYTLSSMCQTQKCTVIENHISISMPFLK